MEQYADTMPDAIQRKRSGSQIVLCLNINAIDEFCKMSGLKRVDDTIGEKTSEWLGANELRVKYIVGDPTKILRAMEQYADKIPDAIQRKRSGPNVGLCLNINAIDEFCKLSGLKRKSDGFKSGEKNVGALDSVQKNKRKIKPDNQKKK